MISGIFFFKDKPHNFLIEIIPKLVPTSSFILDILYSQGDYADEIFFVFKGSAVLYNDISEVVNMKPLVRENECFNVSICIYKSGSYFGDNDVLLSKIGYRSFTCISYEDS